MKGGFTTESFQNPSDLAVHGKKFISRGFKMKKIYQPNPIIFPKKKNTLKNFKKLFLHFSKNKFWFFLYIFKEPKYFLIFPLAFMNDRIQPILKKNLSSQSDEEPIWKIYQKSIRWILEIFSSEPPFVYVQFPNILGTEIEEGGGVR